MIKKLECLRNLMKEKFIQFQFRDCVFIFFKGTTIYSKNPKETIVADFVIFPIENNKINYQKIDHLTLNEFVSWMEELNIPEFTYKLETYIEEAILRRL